MSWNRKSTQWLLLLLSLSFTTDASSQDVNDDGLFDCLDLDLIGMAAVNGSQDLTFDIDGDGTIELRDVESALRLSGLTEADTNFDGVVDRIDMNTYGAHWQRPAAGYCQGDFNYDGKVDASDQGVIGLNWLTSAPGASFVLRAAELTFRETPSNLQAWRDGSFVIADAGPFELVATPERAPDGLLATSLAIRTKDPLHKFVAFDEFEITGEVHQVFPPGPFLEDTPTGVTWFLGRFEGVGNWNRADTQLSVRYWMIGSGGAGGASGIFELNDFSDPTGLQPTVDGFETHVGIGPLDMGTPGDIFTLKIEHQTNFVELARFVTPAKSNAESEGVFFKVGAQGSDANHDPLPFHDVIGLNEPLEIPFFAQPCDFNSDGFCDQQDLDRLHVAVEQGLSDPDLNLDFSEPPLITATDVTAWHNLSEPIPGDTDYDGDVDAADLNNLAANWQINSRRTVVPPPTSWEDGDFNFDGNVDAADLNKLGLNWLRGVDPGNTPVPEPSGFALALYAALRLRRLQKQT